MKKTKRKYDVFIEDMILACEHIAEYTDDMDFEMFRKNNLVVDAVIRNFEIIGEAAKHIPSYVRLKYPQIPWKKMIGMRNLISHEYFGVDYEMVWEIIKNQLPANKEDLIFALKQIRKNTPWIFD